MAAEFVAMRICSMYIRVVCLYGWYALSVVALCGCEPKQPAFAPRYTESCGRPAPETAVTWSERHDQQFLAEALALLESSKHLDVLYPVSPQSDTSKRLLCALSQSDRSELCAALKKKKVVGKNVYLGYALPEGCGLIGYDESSERSNVAFVEMGPTAVYIYRREKQEIESATLSGNGEVSMSLGDYAERSEEYRKWLEQYGE